MPDMSNDRPVVVKNRITGGALGPVWFIGWLFTVGYLHLPLLHALFAIVLWPYFLGQHFSNASVNYHL